MHIDKRFKELTILRVELMCSIIDHLKNGMDNSKGISLMLGRPRRYYEGMLQLLSGNGLIKSLRGPTGGYTLTETGRSSDVLSIVEKIYGPQTSLLFRAWEDLQPSDVVNSNSSREDTP